MLDSQNLVYRVRTRATRAVAVPMHGCMYDTDL